MLTPCEKLKLLPKAKDFLQPGINFEQLDSIAIAMSDTEGVRRLNEARDKLFQFIHHRSKHAA
jgi:hypothetical protein